MDCSKKFPIYDLSADMCVCVCQRSPHGWLLCCVAKLGGWEKKLYWKQKV